MLHYKHHLHLICIWWHIYNLTTSTTTRTSEETAAASSAETNEEEDDLVFNCKLDLQLQVYTLMSFWS